MNSRIRNTPYASKYTSFSSPPISRITICKCKDVDMREDNIHYQSRSEPIPIKCNSFQQSEEARAFEQSVDCAAHYDYATWRMYTRITNARRRRAFSRSGHANDRDEEGSDVVRQEVDAIHHRDCHGYVSVRDDSRGRQSSSMDEEYPEEEDGCVFDLTM